MALVIRLALLFRVRSNSCWQGRVEEVHRRKCLYERLQQNVASLIFFWIAYILAHMIATKYISHKNGPAESIAGFQICLALCTVMLAEISLFAVDCFHNDFAVLVDHITHSLLCGKCFVASSQVAVAQ